MTRHEKRRPRAAFIRTLERMCSRLDERPTFTVTTTDRYLDRRETVDVEIAALWVAGSYARGAATCGDLDVVLDSRSKGPLPSARSVKHAAFGVLPGVSCYTGTPERNSSAVAFPEAVRVWTPGANWRQALALIKLDASAGHFARETDVLPLRPEQMGALKENLEQVVRLKADGVLDWRFLALDSIQPLESPSEAEARVLGYTERWGKASRALMQRILRYLHDRPLIRNRSVRGTSELDCSGVHISVGRPSPFHHRLNELSCSRIVLVPHVSRRGPNGLWELVRGPTHPLVLAASKLCAYASFDSEGKLLHSVLVEGYQIGRVVAVDLFATERAANSASRRRYEPRGALGVTARALRGADLLDIVSCADVLRIHPPKGACRTVAVTWEGMSQVKGVYEQPPAAELLDMIALALNGERLPARRNVGRRSSEPAG